MFLSLNKSFPAPPAWIPQSGPNIWKHNRPGEPFRFARFIFKFQD